MSRWANHEEQVRKRHSQRVIESCDKQEMLDVGDDGYVHFWVPVGPKAFNHGGYLTANDLRIIADELDRRNAEWHKKAQELNG